MTRWELMKEAWKGREPVSTSEIVSGIRAGTIKALQPAVRAGEQFREARPEIAERISRTPVASQIRASVQLRKDIDTAKRQVISSEKNIVLLKTKIDKAPVQDGVFSGTDKQFIQHERDVKAYNTNITQINASNKRIAALEGKKFIPKIERAVSSHIPTLSDISRKGAQFRVKYPEAAAKIHSTFQAAHAKTERVGTQSQREALAGYTYGSYSSLQKQPVKTAASFAIGGASVKAMRMVGLVGKAYGAGKWSKRMGKAAQYGIILYYGKKSSEYIMSAPNARVAGERAAKIMYTEVLPMAAGIKAVEGAPKVVKVTKTQVKKLLDLPSREFNKQMRAMEVIHEIGMVGAPKGRKFQSFGKTKKEMLEQAIKLGEEKKGSPLTTKEIEILETKFSTKRLKSAKQVYEKRQAERRAEAEEIKRKLATGEYKEVKIGTGAQQQIQLVRVEQKVLTKQSLKEVVKVKEQFELKIDPKQKIKLKQEAEQRALAKEKEAKLKAEQKFESVLKEEQRLATQAKQKLIAHEREMMAIADAMPSFKRASKVKQIQKVKVVTKTEQRVIARLTQKQKQVMTTATRTKNAVKTATKTAQKVKTEVRTATKAKVKTKAQQKTKLATLIALRQATQTDVQLLTKTLAQLKAATKEVQEIKPAVAMVAATTTKARTLTDLDTLKRIVRESIVEEKAAARELTRAIRAIEALKLKIPPPPVPKMKIPTKKKITKRQREMMVLKQKNLNAVATFRDLLGGL